MTAYNVAPLTKSEDKTLKDVAYFKNLIKGSICKAQFDSKSNISVSQNVMFISVCHISLKCLIVRKWSKWLKITESVYSPMPYTGKRERNILNSLSKNQCHFDFIEVS